MKIRNSLLFSLLAHLLVFGAAASLARYSGVTLLHAQDSIVVSLLPSAEQKHIRATGSRSVEPPRENMAAAAAPAESRQMRMHEDAVVSPVAMPVTSGTNAEGHAAVGAGDNSPKPLSVGKQESGGQRGGIAPEEWATIVAAIERTKNYPRLARERGIEGVVRLRFKLNAAGDVEVLELVKSSGYDILDTASIRAVYKAVPFPHVSGWVEMPIKYVLQ